MPRVRPFVIDKEKNFGAEMKAAITRKRMNPSEVAEKVGFTGRTMSNRFNHPADMTLGQMRLFIQTTGMDVELVKAYLTGK